MVTATMIAARILDSFAHVRALPADCYAAGVNVRHDPPMLEFDGLWDRDRLFAHTDSELCAWRVAMPDVRFEDISLQVGPAAVRVKLTLTGTLADGRIVRVAVRQSYEILDGLVVGVEAWVDPTTVMDLVAALGQSDTSRIRESTN